MAEFLHKFAQILLLLFGLTPTDIESISEEVIATVEEIPGGTPCLAVWFSQDSLLTAASCFDELGERNFTEKPHIDVAITTWNYKFDKTDKIYFETTKNYKGEAIVHPHYKRKGEFTFAYDLAVVRVQKERRMGVWEWIKQFIDVKYVDLCSKPSYSVENSARMEWNVFTEPTRESREYAQRWKKGRRYHESTFSQASPNYFAVTAGRTALKKVYYIDLRKQFTAEHSNFDSSNHVENYGTIKQDYDVFDVPIGGPVFEAITSGRNIHRLSSFSKVKYGICVAGIVNFEGEIQSQSRVYITVTKVYPVRKWIEFTRQYLKKPRTKREGVKIYGTEGEAFWSKNNINLDPIGPSNENERQAGNPLSEADLKDLLKNRGPTGNQ